MVHSPPAPQATKKLPKSFDLGSFFLSFPIPNLLKCYNSILLKEKTKWILIEFFYFHRIRIGSKFTN